MDYFPHLSDGGTGSEKLRNYPRSHHSKWTLTVNLGSPDSKMWTPNWPIAQLSQ